MEINEENKARFFALYIGQNVFVDYSQPVCIKWNFNPHGIWEGWHLSLRSIDQLAPNELEQVGIILGWDKQPDFIARVKGRTWCEFFYPGLKQPQTGIC